jgi:cytoskeletal protein RodZ
MKDQTYGLLIALICVALAIAGIYYLTADTPIWNDWKSTTTSEKDITDQISPEDATPSPERPSTETPSSSSGKVTDERIPPDENASAAETPAGGTLQPDQVITKQAPGETIDMRPPEQDAAPDSGMRPAPGKELLDRIPATEGWL